MNFKKWLTENFAEPLPLGDPARRPDLIRGGLSGCEDVPLNMKSMCTPRTSAFQTGKLPKKKSHKTF